MSESTEEKPLVYHAPRWIWTTSPKLFPDRIKHVYAYISLFGENGNWQWNCRLAEKFHVSKSTIKRYLKWLHDHNLIAITSTRTPYRRIHPRYIPTRDRWLELCIFIHRKQQSAPPIKPKPKIEYKSPIDFRKWAAEKMNELKNGKRLKNEPL